MQDQITELTLQIDAPDIDANELDDLARLLRAEIEQLDVMSVENVKKGPLPDGAMAVDWVEIGNIAVKLSPVVIPPLIAALRAWIDRQYRGSKQTKLKLGISWGNFDFNLDQATSREEAANISRELADKIEAEQKD